MESSGFEYIRHLVREHAAIVIDPEKEYLVESRLTPLARREGFTSLEALIVQLRKERYNVLHRKVIEAMATNETSFFRDVHPFEALKRRLLPELMAHRAAERTLHIWCAASSSGQEPYSIAMLLREHFPALRDWNLILIASDFSREILEWARQGVYSQLEVNRGLPAALLVKYFEQRGTVWHIRDNLRDMIDFREINLAEAWPTLPVMDLIFVRNVMIYFDVDTKKSILERMHRHLKADGYLFLGTAETTLTISDAFERVQIDRTICYRPAP